MEEDYFQRFQPYLEQIKDYPVRLLALRGFEKMGRDGNDLGVYDDAIKIFEGTKEVAHFRASCDPGWYFIKNPINPKGCARIANGLWWYGHGLHSGKPAFRQYEPFMIERLDRNGVLVSKAMEKAATNLHSGGSNVEDVGRASAGCQIVWSEVYFGGSETKWGQFYALLSGLLKKHGMWRKEDDLGNEFPYLIQDL